MSRSALLLCAFLALAVALAPARARAEWLAPCTPAGSGPACHFWKGTAILVDDGDTIDVSIPTSSGRRRTVRVRITGIQAMEQRVYTRDPRKRRGECHALDATARLEHLVRTAGGRVRLSAQNPASRSGIRLRRSVAVKVRGYWRDVGRTLLAGGYALWLPNRFEYAWNATYNELAQRAAVAHRNIWDSEGCGYGPSEDARLQLTVHPDPDGDDFEHVNGEYVTIENGGPTTVSLEGWWLRDSSPHPFRFPAWAAIPPGGAITVRVGRGDETEQTLYWGFEVPIFENAASGRGMGDGAYLFDPQGDLRAWMTYPCFVACADREH